MAKNRSMTRKQNHDAPWSDLIHDVLFLIMMQLGVVDFVAFSGVCKSWYSFALSNWTKFMGSRSPISVSIPENFYKKDNHCYLEDFDGRRLKILLPRSANRTYIGFTCGYLVLFGRKTHDLLLVNPITSHKLHFPSIPSLENDDPTRIKAKLVFSSSLSGLVLVVLNAYTKTLLFSLAGTRSWNKVTSSFSLNELHVFKGKIYIITKHIKRILLFIPRLDPDTKLTLLKIMNPPKLHLKRVEFASSDENLYLLYRKLGDPDMIVWELDLDEMKIVLSFESTRQHCLFVEDMMYRFVIKPELWADPRSQYERYTSPKVGSLLQICSTSS